jgi:hypothetical protein
MLNASWTFNFVFRTNLFCNLIDMCFKEQKIYLGYTSCVGLLNMHSLVSSLPGCSLVKANVLHRSSSPETRVVNEIIRLWSWSPFCLPPLSVLNADRVAGALVCLVVIEILTLIPWITDQSPNSSTSDCYKKKKISFRQFSWVSAIEIALK